MRLWEKSRQVGATTTDAFDSVMKACPAEAKFDVWVSSRDELQARLYVEDSQQWAKLLNIAVVDLGLVLIDPKLKVSAQVLQLSNVRPARPNFRH
jgi:phage FluMu gp28-like protein